MVEVSVVEVVVDGDAVVGAGVTVVGAVPAATAEPMPMTRLPITHPVARQADAIHNRSRFMCPLRIACRLRGVRIASALRSPPMRRTPEIALTRCYGFGPLK